MIIDHNLGLMTARPQACRKPGCNLRVSGCLPCQRATGLQFLIAYSNLRPSTKRKHFWRVFVRLQYNVTFGRLKRELLDAKPDGSVTANVML